MLLSLLERVSGVKTDCSVALDHGSFGVRLQAIEGPREAWIGGAAATLMPALRGTVVRVLAHTTQGTMRETLPCRLRVRLSLIPKPETGQRHTGEAETEFLQHHTARD